MSNSLLKCSLGYNPETRGRKTKGVMQIAVWYISDSSIIELIKDWWVNPFAFFMLFKINCTLTTAIGVCVCVCLLDQWRITVPEGEKVRLTFTSFDLVPEVCGDFIQVYDGYKAGSSLLGEHDMFPVCTEECKMMMNRDFKIHQTSSRISEVYFESWMCYYKAMGSVRISEQSVGFVQH